MRAAPPFLPSALFILAAIGGCVDEAGGAPPSTEPQASAQPAEFDDTTGAIEGIVHDDSLAPIPQAIVALIEAPEQLTETDDSGRFSFSRVPPGEYRITAQKLGYESIARAITVTAAETTPVDLVLNPLPVTEPWEITKIQNGLFGCGMSWRPAVAVSGISICGVLSLYLNNTNYDKFLLYWEISGEPPEWDGAVFEMAWKSNQALGAGLTVIWETRDCANNATSRFARVSGHSPLRGELNETQINDRIQNITDRGCGKEDCNENKCLLMTRVFSYPDTLGSSAAADVGITIQQSFTQYQSEFYNQPAPPGFSAIQDT